MANRGQRVLFHENPLALVFQAEVDCCQCDNTHLHASIISAEPGKSPSLFHRVRLGWFPNWVWVSQNNPPERPIHTYASWHTCYTFAQTGSTQRCRNAPLLAKWVHVKSTRGFVSERYLHPLSGAVVHSTSLLMNFKRKQNSHAERAEQENTSERRLERIWVERAWIFSGQVDFCIIQQRVSNSSARCCCFTIFERVQTLECIRISSAERSFFLFLLYIFLFFSVCRKKTACDIYAPWARSAGG